MKSIFLLAENFKSCAACLSAHWSRGQLFEHPSWASAYSWKQNSAWDMLQRRVAATKEGNELSGGMGHACSIITAPLLSGKVEMFEHCNQILDFSPSWWDVLDFFVLSALFVCFETPGLDCAVITLLLYGQMCCQDSLTEALQNLHSFWAQMLSLYNVAMHD